MPMRWLTPLMLATVALAGCAAEDPAPAALPQPTIGATGPDLVPAQELEPQPQEPEPEPEPEQEPEAEPEPDPVPPLKADAGGPYTGGAWEWVPVAASYSGGEGEASCAWSGDVELRDAFSCATEAMAPEAGTWNLLVEVRRGQEAAEAEATLEATLPAANRSIQGRFHLYDEELGTDLGGTLTLAGANATHLAGRNVTFAARFVEGAGLGEAAVAAVVFSLDGHLMLGPVEALVQEDEDLAGDPAGHRFDAGPVPLGLPEGTYLLAFHVDLGGVVSWAEAGDGHAAGHKPFDVMELPA